MGPNLDARVAIGAMKHESNTFTTLTTSLDAFTPVTGEEVFETPAWIEGSATAGIIDTLDAAGVDLVPTLFGRSIPSGVVEEDAYEEMKESIVGGVRRTKDLDAVCLDLHGSMYATNESDPEGDLLAAIRETVGVDVPIICSLDMHATVTERMVAAADGFTAYRTAPHTDVYETGVRAAELLSTVLAGNASPVVERVRLPMLLAGEQSETDTKPMSDLIALLAETDEKAGVLSSSYLLGFPWADSSHNGVCALVVGDADIDPDAAETNARTLAARFWEYRREFDFTTEAHSLEVALDKAMVDDRQPVVIADSGDNPTAGATEDLTIVLKSLFDRGIADALVAVIADPEAHAACAEVGKGAEVRLDLGCVEYDSNRGSEPLSFDARVKRLGTAGGIESAVVESAGIRIVVTDERTAVSDPAFLDALSVDPAEFDIVVIKSGYLSSKYQTLAARQMLALTPGETNEVLSELPYEAVPRPIYPLNDDTEWAFDAGET